MNRAIRVLCMCSLASLACAALGCAALRPVTASSGDLADYRETRTQRTWGRRLAAMQRYLERRPDGAWAAEVREELDREEPRFFARASDSREGVRGYLTDLPRGPHADAAVSLLVAFDTKVEDVETERMLKAARTTEARLGEAAEQRRAADEWVANALAALADDAPWGKPRGASPALVAQLKGPRQGTWGGLPDRVDVRLPFAAPGRGDLFARTLEATLALEGDELRAATLSGPDLFVRWAEIDAVRALDPSRTEDRVFAASRVRERLAGLLERRFPEARCAKGAADADLLARRCDGRAVRVVMGGAAGDVDKVDFSVGP